MDTVQQNGRTCAMAPGVNNRVSARSTRKKKSQILSPKKFCDQLLNRVPGTPKSAENGCADFHRELSLESPTFRHYFLAANKEKNISEAVWLYDNTRVIVPEVDYIHASWVDGFKPHHYILAQAPHNEVTKKNFFKMLAHVKAEGMILCEGSDEISNFIAPKFEVLAAKKSAEKDDGLSTAVITENGVNKLKVIKLGKWISEVPKEINKDYTPAELADAVDKIRKFLGNPSKGPVVIVCKDGATKSGVVAYIDTESDRLAKMNKVKSNEVIKHIRLQRCNTFESQEVFEFALNTAIEMVSTAIKNNKKK